MAHVWSVTASEIKHRRFLPLGWKADSLREIHRAVDQFELDLRKRVWEVVQKACERAERVAPLDVRAFWSGRATYARALMRLGDVETALKVLTPVEGASSAAGSGVPLGITLLRATCLLRLSKHPDALTLLSSLGPSSGGSSGRCLSAYLATWSAASVPKEKVGEMFARAHALIASEPNSAPCPLTLHREAFFLLRRQANRSGAIANWQSVIELTSGTPERKVRREAARLLYDLFAIRTDVDIKPAAANFSHTNKAISGRRLIHVAVIQSGLDHLTTTRRLKARPTDFTVTILSPQDLLSTSLRLDAFDVLLYHPRCTALLPDSAFYSQHHRACQLVQAFVQAGGGFIGVGQAAAALMCDEEFGIRLPLERLERNRKLRGEGLVSVNVSQAGATMLHAPAGATLMRYSHGPLLLPTHSAEEERRQREEAELRKLKATAPTATAADLAAASQPTAAVSTAHAAIEFLAHFSSDVTISGVLTSLPAIVRTRLSSGQVVLFAAMPIEQRGQAEWIERAIEQAGRK
jgi:hypothetical protein